MDGSTEDHEDPNNGNGGGHDNNNPTPNPDPRTVLEREDLGDEDMSGSNPTILLPNQSDEVSHLGLDIGGSLIKLIYFTRRKNEPINDQKREIINSTLDITNPNIWSYPILGGRLHFVKFETSKINECLDFICSKQLHRGGMGSRHWQSESPHMENTVIKVTGGGAHKYSDLFNERLGITIEKEDEMNCLVAGANFLLKAIRHEAFTHIEGQKEFVQIDSNDLYPYLLVNIGSGVSIIKVDGEGVFKRVSGTSLGGATFWGLGKLLTNLNSFDDQLELSQRGDNRNTDMLVGDIYGGNFDKLELSPSTIASSFAKVAAGNKDSKYYAPEDLSLSLLRMISYNIGQISYLNALLFKTKRIFFGGYFIRGHAYTMDTISFAVHFWSKGKVQAMFLRHEGFLGAIGAFTSYEEHGLDDLMAHQSVERFPMGVPYTGGTVHGSPLGPLNEKKPDPPSIEKCTQIIPGLLKNINSKVAELEEMNKKVATMEKTIQKLWIGLGASLVVLFIVLV